jgi:ethanolamine utilization microcompartment shell protein EutS
MLNSRNAPNYFSGNGAAHLTSTGDETSTVNRTRSVREYVPNNQNKIQHVSVKPIENVDLYLQQHARNAISTGMGGIPFAKTAAFEVQQ